MLKYDNGYAGYLEVLYAQNELFAAELSTVTTQVEAFAQLVNVYGATGGGWVDRGGPARAGAAGDGGIGGAVGRPRCACAAAPRRRPPKPPADRRPAASDGKPNRTSVSGEPIRWSALGPSPIDRANARS